MKHLIVCMLAFTWLSSSAWALDQHAIIVVNSDKSVPKYALAEASFHPANVEIIANVDLKSLRDPANQVKNLIRNTNAAFVYCIGSPAYKLVNMFTEDQRIVFSAALAWDNDELTDETYGVSAELLSETQLTTFRFFFPTVKTIGFLYSEHFADTRMKEIQSASADLEFPVLMQKVSQPSEIPKALQQLAPRVDAFWLMADPGVISNRATVEAYFKAADQLKKPVMAYSQVFIPFGAAFALSPDTATIGRQASSLVDRLSAGKTVMPKIGPPAASNTTLNLKQTSKLNVEVREMAVSTANQIIE